MENIFYLTVEEFWVILHATKIKKIMTFKVICRQELSEDDTAEAVMGLSRKGLISSDGKGMSFSAGMLEIINVLNDSRYMMIERGYRNQVPISCIFCNKTNAVKVQIDERRNNSVRIQMGAKEEVLGEIFGYDFMPGDEPVEKNTAFEKEEDSAANEELIVKLERYHNTDNEGVSFVIVTRYSTYDTMMVTVDGGESKTVPYSEELLNKFYHFPEKWEEIMEEI